MQKFYVAIGNNRLCEAKLRVTTEEHMCQCNNVRYSSVQYIQRRVCSMTSKYIYCTVDIYTHANAAQKNKKVASFDCCVLYTVSLELDINRHKFSFFDVLVGHRKSGAFQKIFLVTGRNRNQNCLDTKSS